MFKMDFVKESWQRKYQAVQNDEVPWTPLVKPIEVSRIVLVTTGGVHLKSDTPFDMSDSNGDPSFRMIPSQAKPEELMITHDLELIFNKAASFSPFFLLTLHRFQPALAGA